MYQDRNVFLQHGGDGNTRFSRFSFRINGLYPTGTFVALVSPRTEARHRGSLKRKRQTYWHAFAEGQFHNDSRIPGWASGWCCKRWATRQELARTGGSLQRPPTRLEGGLSGHGPRACAWPVQPGRTLPARTTGRRKRDRGRTACRRVWKEWGADRPAMQALRDTAAVTDAIDIGAAAADYAAHRRDGKNRIRGGRRFEASMMQRRRRPYGHRIRCVATAAAGFV